MTAAGGSLGDEPGGTPDARGLPPSSGQPGDGGAANNPTPDPAVESGEANPILDELLDTLGDVERGLDLRAQEGRDLQKRVLEREAELQQTRDEAEQADDAEAYKQATAELEELQRAWLTLQNDLEESSADGAKPEPADGQPLPGGEHRGDRVDEQQPGGGEEPGL